jgi:hypothetical protein
MPDFTVRIQLHDAAPDDDARLHAAMLEAGHTDHLKSKDGTAWVLPTGEFNLRADLEVTGVLAQAKAIAERAMPDAVRAPWVLVTQSAGRKWFSERA